MVLAWIALVLGLISFTCSFILLYGMMVTEKRIKHLNNIWEGVDFDGL